MAAICAAMCCGEPGRNGLGSMVGGGPGGAPRKGAHPELSVLFVIIAAVTVFRACSAVDARRVLCDDELFNLCN